MTKKIILLLTALLAFMIASCTAPLLPGGGGMSGTDDTGTVQFSWSQPGQANNSRSSFSRNVVATGNNIQDAKKVVISIEAADGTVVYSQKELKLFNFNGSFISEPLSLKVGSYKLTEYLLLDAAGTVIYATPKAGSAKAHLVTNPLPVNFTVTKDASTSVKPEVVDAAEVTPADFGYATFGFNEAKVFNFLVSVMVYDASADNFMLTDAAMDLTTDAKAYTFNLAPLTNNLAVNDVSSDYTLTISKVGYETHKVTYTNAELKAFFQTPLVVVLTKKQTPVNKLITFADLGLEKAVRDAIKKPTGDIYTNDVINLTSLQASGWAISNLSGIEHLTSLHSLYLNTNRISDISPLSGLTKLTTLQLSNNRISDISQLRSLTNLEEFNTSKNSISDISILSSLTKLRHINIGSNNITDINALSGLTDLTVLYLTGNKIGSADNLSTLTQLSHLYLGGNSISDISPLSSLVNLKSLELSGNGISDINTLSSLTNITYLHLNNNLLTDMGVISLLTGLTHLIISENQISDISALSALADISYLNLQNNKIVDLTPLVNNTGLDNYDTVNLKGNPLSIDALNVQVPNLQARGVRFSL